MYKFIIIGCYGSRVMLIVLSRCCFRGWGEPLLRDLFAIYRAPSELLHDPSGSKKIALES